MARTIAECEDALRIAARDLERARRRVFKVGSRVAYDHGNHQRSGAVNMIGIFADDLRLTTSTGREVWVHTSRCRVIGRGAPRG